MAENEGRTAENYPTLNRGRLDRQQYDLLVESNLTSLFQNGIFTLYICEEAARWA